MKGGINFEEWKEIVKKNRRSLRSKSNSFKFEPESLTYGAEKAVKSPEYGQMHTITYNVEGIDISEWPTQIKSGQILTLPVEIPEGCELQAISINTDYTYEDDVITINNVQSNLTIELVAEVIGYSQDYLTFVAKGSGTFTFTPQDNNVISYSTDNGDTWTEGNSVSVNDGDEVLWKGIMVPSSGGIGAFSSTAEFDVQGNAMSLLFGDNFKGQTNLTGKDRAFYYLFNGNTKVVNAENLSLPATTLTEYCYKYMFIGCTNLTTAPELPAATLAEGCYHGMFQGCTSLETAPELPAETLVNYCYGFMFLNCTSLNYIKAMFTTTPSTSYTQNWVIGVSASGTFVKNAAAEWDVSGISGIPNDWTVETA